MQQPKLIPVQTRKPYVPLLSETERLAYAAAHKILTTRPYLDKLACPGGRRTAAVDAIALIIMQTFEKENDGKN